MHSAPKNTFCGKTVAAVLTLLAALAFFTPEAFAHAKMLASKPANGEKSARMPQSIELVFSERLQATALNTIVVTGRDGTRVDKNAVTLSEDGTQMFIALEASGAGVYAVEWKALSADDHLMKGKFVLTVTGPKTTETAATAPVPEISNTEGADKAPAAAEKPAAAENETSPRATTASGTNPLQSLARWLTYLAMMTLFGGFAFRLFVVGPAFGHLEPEEKKRAFGRMRERFVGLTRLSLILIIVAAILSLILQTSALLDKSFAEAIAPSNLYRVLTQTGFGAPWALQIAAALAIAATVFFSGRRKADSLESDGARALRWMSLIFAGFMLGSLSLTGHARAAQSEYKLAVVSDWLHLIAAGIWVGGIFQLVLTLPKGLAPLDELKRLAVLSRVIPRFSSLAIVATALLALTGVYNSWIHLASARDLVTTPYGITLLMKIILFLLMLPLGAFNRFYMRPRVEKLAGATESGGRLKTIKDFYFVMWLEAAFAAAVLLLAAILAFLPHSQGHHAAIGGAAEKAAVKRIF
jgi:copper transport protein